MRRVAALSVLVGALGWLAVAAAQMSGKTGVLPVQPGSGRFPAKEVANKEAPAKQAADVDYGAILSERVNFPGVNDPKVTLDDYLKQLSKQYNLTFEINARAFANEGLKDPEQVFIAERDLPARNNVRVGTGLRLVLARIPCTSGAAFLVRRDSIEITTNQFVAAEIWGPDYDGPRMPLVHLRAEKAPLSEVLGQLADQSGLNIMYGGPADKAALPISVRFNNVPVDTAVRMLAAQAGFGVVHRDNVMLVTTEEKASSLNFRFAEENPDPDGNKHFRQGGGPVVIKPQAGM